MNRSIIHAVILLACLPLGGCGMIKDLQDMHDATLELEKNTKELNAKTQELHDLTDSLVELNRQGMANEIRQESLGRLRSAATLEEKISQAGHYVYAYEFQLAKESIDTPAKLTALYQEAMEEFFRLATEFARGKKQDDFNPASSDPASQNLYALVTALHVVNTIQSLEASNGGRKLISILDLIERGLEELSEVTRGERLEAEMSPFAREVAHNEDLAVYLLRLRFNFMAALPLADLSDIDAGGVRGLMEKLRLMFTQWDARELAKLNSPQIRFCAEKLEMALATRDLLLRLKIDPKLDANLGKIYKNMRLTSTLASEAGPEANALVSRLAKAQARLLSGE